MSQKFLYVGSDGLNWEGGNTFEESDFINASAGSGDSGKPIVLDADGLIDGSMIDDGDIDHGGLSGLGDDDHSQYHNDTRGDARYYTQTLIASVSNGEGASLVGIEDSAGNFAAVNVEAALAELQSNITETGVSYTASGAIAKGDACFISANDSVSVYSTLANSERIAGLAFASAADTAAVKVSANDVVITGILTGQTAGDAQYWTGTAHSSTMPSTASAYVWQTGMAKNATDIAVQVMKIKKNSA